MKVDLYSVLGVKKGTVELPATVFEMSVNTGLMHQAVCLQQANRRYPIAHSKTRSEIRGSTRKLHQQKGTGRARRGSIRSPLLRGGNKAFGPSRIQNFTVDMPRQMRHAALRSSLSYRAAQNAIFGLEGQPDFSKTKDAHVFMEKLPIDIGRKILIVLLESEKGRFARSVRNIPGVKTILATYLNPEDVLTAHKIVFVLDALKKVEEIFGKSKKFSRPVNDKLPAVDKDMAGKKATN